MTHALTLGTIDARSRARSRSGLVGLVAGIGRRIKSLALLTGGSLMVLTGIAIAPLPGPFGLPISVVGLVLILRSSFWAKRQFIRAQYAQPKFIYPFRRLMRKKPEFAPVMWQQALRMERLLLRRNKSVLKRGRRSAKRSWAAAQRRSGF
jgi:hypothetical protein